MNFRFQNLIGAPYRGGDAAVAGDSILVTATGNRVSTTDLSRSSSRTLPFEASSSITRLAVAPGGGLVVVVDSTSPSPCLILASLHSGLAVATMRLKRSSSVTAMKFSPDGLHVAVALSGGKVQIWRTPEMRKTFFPFHLEDEIAVFTSSVTALDWSPDSEFLLCGSKDLSVRLIRIKERRKFKPFMFLGHRGPIVGAFFGVKKTTGSVDRVYTISRDGAIFTWNIVEVEADSDDAVDEDPPEPGTPEIMESVVDGAESVTRKRKCMNRTPSLDKVSWKLDKKDFFMQAPAQLTACDYHRGLDLAVVGFSNGVFGLYQMPDFVCLHRLSISREKITTAAFNKAGNWLVFGCAKLSQLLVWEWRSESYILKQQGHYFDVNCVSYSPDSQLIATGADDNKVKVWTVSTGFCFVTFSEHTNAVTALHFLSNNHSLLSASLDGTVRAWDLFRYRNFRTFTSPSPRQFVSLAANQSGEIICAGTLDSFEIFVWCMKTGRLMDVLSGHEGPVHGLMFSPLNDVLVSSSWDKTVKLWNVFESKGVVESFPHSHDVLTVVYRPDGKQIACSTIDGLIHFWDPFEGLLTCTIEGRRDIAGGRMMSDRRSATKPNPGHFFTTLCYSADGSYILAAGNSKYICMYDIADQVLLRRFQITRNLSLDGVLDFLNSKRMTRDGPIDLIDDEQSDVEDGIDRQMRGSIGFDMPGSAPNRGRPVARTKCVRFAPTGRSWAAATTEGVLLYSIDDSFVFDPTDLDVDVTPEAVDEALTEHNSLRGLILSLRLNEDSLIKKCIFSADPSEIAEICPSIPFKYIQRLIEALADLLESCPHLEFVLQWGLEICKVHGNYMHQNSRTLLPTLKSLQKSITRLHEDLKETCSYNKDLLKYLCSAGKTGAT